MNLRDTPEVLRTQLIRHYDGEERVYTSLVIQKNVRHLDI